MPLMTAPLDTPPQDHPLTRQHTDTDRGLPQAAALLAYTGALPPILAAMLFILRRDDFGPQALQFLTLYCGLMLAFFGGVRWGVAVMLPNGPTFRHLLGGIAPFLLTLPIFLIDHQLIKLCLIVVALPVLLFDDCRATNRGDAPDWYIGVRMPLTILIETALTTVLAVLVFTQ